MFSSGPNYNKLKTNLRLAINRLKLLEKKKTELAQKERKDIADYLGGGKIERARIRVEHIIREDYLVEAMEVTEMYCDLLLARFGLINQMKDLDEGLAESISSLIWVAPRLQTDVAELKVIADQLGLKYGKPYAQACKEQQVQTISEKLIHKLSVQAPPKILVEKYLIEIAKIYNVEYEPDPQVMREGEWGTDPLIRLDELRNNLGGGGSNDGASGGGGGGSGGGGMNIPPQPTGFIGYPQHPSMPDPFSYPQKNPNALPDDLNLPDVPGQQPSYHGGAMGVNAFNYPPSAGGPPPPPDPSADTSGKINNNLQNYMGGGSGTNNWDGFAGIDNYPPPPPYTSIDPTTGMSGGGHAPNAPNVPNAPTVHPMGPPAGMPHSAPFPGARPVFPPDVRGHGAMPPMDNRNESEQPKPAPRSKFDANEPFNLPELPSVPDDSPSHTSNIDNNTNNTTQDDIDFDDLTKRFEDLKKKK